MSTGAHLCSCRLVNSQPTNWIWLDELQIHLLIYTRDDVIDQSEEHKIMGIPTWCSYLQQQITNIFLWPFAWETLQWSHNPYFRTTQRQNMRRGMCPLYTVPPHQGRHNNWCPEDLMSIAEFLTESENEDWWFSTGNSPCAQRDHECCQCHTRS